MLSDAVILIEGFSNYFCRAFVSILFALLLNLFEGYDFSFTMFLGFNVTQLEFLFDATLC